MNETFDRNIGVLKEKYPIIYNKLKNMEQRKNYELVDCADGNKTVKIINGDKRRLLHSKFNPIKEAEVFAENNMNEQCSVNILYGFGMGYHVKEMHKRLEVLNHLYVFDINLNVFHEAMKYNDLTEVLEDDRVYLQITPDIEKLTRKISRAMSSNSNTAVILHVPSVQSIPDELEDFKFALEEWNMRKTIDEKNPGLLYENYISNRANIDRNVGDFFGRFKNIPFLIVSAGPSLDKNIELIKEVKNKAVIMSVGSALKPLINKQIKPDFFIISDPQEVVCKQIYGIEQIGIPAVFLATASKKTVEMYTGPKFIAIQNKAYAMAGEEKYIVSTGGSVATTSLDIALKMGGNPIIFVGQDLAFTGDRVHTDGYAHHPGNVRIKALKNMRSVKGVDGGTLHTTIGFLSFKKWIETRIAQEKGKTFINATEGGAFIKGTYHTSLKSVIENNLSNIYDIEQTVKSIIREG